MENLKRLLSIIVIATLIGCFIYKIGYWVRPTDTDGAYIQVETFHSLPENSIDVMVYGSSHAFRGLSTMELYDKYGIGAYNYGWNWQACNTTNLFLKDSLVTQNPKVALIETYRLGTVLQDWNMDAQIYYSRYVHNKEAVRSYIRQCFGDDRDRYIAYYMPICAFHDNWNTLSPESFHNLEVGTMLRKTMGFAALDLLMEIEIPDCRNFEQLDFSEIAIKEMTDMVETCHSRGIDVVFYTAPWQGEYNYSEAMKRFANDNGCEYYNLFELVDQVGLDGRTDFSDEEHLNISGAEKVSDYLGQILIDHYDLKDMRLVDGNLWEEAKLL